MKARRNNPLDNFEQKIDGGVNNIFAFLFRSPLQPTEIDRRLINAMEDNVRLQGGGKSLVPTVYDIYISVADHQRLSPGADILIEDWQKHMIAVARERNYTLPYDPILRLHGDTKLRTGAFPRIVAELRDAKHMGGEGTPVTTVFTPEQLAQMRAQQGQAAVQPTPGVPFAGGSSPNQPGGVPFGSMPSYPPVSSIPPIAPLPGPGALAMPPARLGIRMPQGNQQIYRIEKPVINIGRQLTNDIIVEDKRVSRYHAKIQYQNGAFTIYDLGSTNGITVNGVPNLRQHTFRDGDRFTIGSYDFYFESKVGGR